MIAVKKKIAIVSSMKGTGGTELTLVSFLKHLPCDCYDVTVFLVGKSGKLVEQIPDWIKIKYIKTYSKNEYLLNCIKQKRLQDIGRYIAFIFAKRISSRQTSSAPIRNFMSEYERVLGRYERIDEWFDVAVTWALPNSIQTVFTLKNINAKRKALWIHMDVQKDVQPDDANVYFEQYDRIFCVSKACKASFDLVYPECSDRTSVCYNIIDVPAVKKAASDPVDIDQTCFNLVTCGRLSSEKQPLFAIDIVKNLIAKGYKKFKWYFVGDGKLMETMHHKIEEHGLGEYIVLVGHKDNPYPWVKAADLYIQMSMHESFCLAIAEAQILGVPTVATCFPAAYEIIRPGVTGYITKNDWKAISDQIEYIWNNLKELEQIKSNIHKNKFELTGDVCEFLEYIDSDIRNLEVGISRDK